MEAVCGLCLSRDCHIKSITDYEIQKNHPGELQSLIMEATGIEMMNENDLAKGICISCTKMVVSVIKFRRKCQRIHEAIKTMGQSLVREREKPALLLEYNEAPVKNEVPLNFIEPHAMDEVPPASPDSVKWKEEEKCKSEPPGSPDSFTWEEDEESKLIFSKAPFSFETPLFIDTSTSTRKKPVKKVNNKTQKRVQQNSGLCEICGVYYNYLRHHMSQHLDDSVAFKYKCGVCTKRFRTNSSLRTHERYHGDRKLSCEICGKMWYNKSHLRKHIRTHSSERPFSCEICHKSFRQKTYLNLHIHSMHQADRPTKHECPTCAKGFPTLVGLKQHMVLHRNF